MSLLARIEDDLALSLPQYFCCNCGEAEEVRAVSTPLAEVHRLRLGRTLLLELDLPYCRRCAQSATRRPVGLAKKVLVAAVLAVPVGIVAMITPLANVLGVFAFYVAVAAVFAIVFAGFSLQKPRGPQTSYHQPVRLVSVQRRSGRVSGLTLSFTHVRYARTFAKANAEAIGRGALDVLGT